MFKSKFVRERQDEALNFWKKKTTNRRDGGSGSLRN
jgi:hypothetical protein